MYSIIYTERTQEKRLLYVLPHVARDETEEYAVVGVRTLVIAAADMTCRTVGESSVGISICMWKKGLQFVPGRSW